MTINAADLRARRDRLVRLARAQLDTAIVLGSKYGAEYASRANSLLAQAQRLTDELHPDRARPWCDAEHFPL